MTKKYFYLILFMFFSSLSLSAQENKDTSTGNNKSIEGLNIYPNPAISTNRIYITSKSIQSKKIEIYDVLGKKVLESTINGREFSVSNLTSGVYFIKIKEGEATATTFPASTPRTEPLGIFFTTFHMFFDLGSRSLRYM